MDELFRVLVCGGRNYGDFAAVDRELSALLGYYGMLLVIQGGAKGADALAKQWALERPGLVGLITEEARWNDTSAIPYIARAYKSTGGFYNAAAGSIRNQKMIDDHKPQLVLAFPGDSGTRDMVKRALAAGITVRSVP